MFDSTSTIRDHFASVTETLGIEDVSTLRIYNKLSVEIDRLTQAANGAMFKDPRQAKAVETVIEGLKHAGDWFGTPVIRGAIDDFASRQILIGARDLEAEMRAQQHPFPRAFALVQSLAHVVGTMKVAAEADIETARRNIYDAAHKPNASWAGVKEAQAAREAAVRAAQPLQIAGKPLGEIVVRFKAVKDHFPELMRENPSRPQTVTPVANGSADLAALLGLPPVARAAPQPVVH